MHKVTKSYRDFPAAHRQPKHDGHCALIHGHNWGWDITFSCDTLDECGFVIDVGKLDKLKAFLTDHFDHTLLLNMDDPLLAYLKGVLLTPNASESETPPIAKIVALPNCGMEGLARYVYQWADSFCVEHWSRGLRVVEVVCWEDGKNRATYCEQ